MIMTKSIKKRTVFIIGFWVIFVVLFIVSHKLLSNIIIHYQQSPAQETTEAYQLIKQYQQPIIEFYKQHQRCPSMADKKQLMPEVEAYHYVKTIRLLADPANHSCFITAVMRGDTPSEDVKNGLITLAYDVSQMPINDWACYTNITNIYTVAACRNKPLPENFQRVHREYIRSIQ